MTRQNIASHNKRNVSWWLQPNDWVYMPITRRSGTTKSNKHEPYSQIADQRGATKIQANKQIAHITGINTT